MLWLFNKIVIESEPGLFYGSNRELCCLRRPYVVRQDTSSEIKISCGEIHVTGTGPLCLCCTASQLSPNCWFPVKVVWVSNQYYRYCWGYSPQRFCLHHLHGRFGTRKKHCIHSGSSFNCSIRDGTLCSMIMHRLGISYQVAVTPSRRKLSSAVFVHFICVPNSEIDLAENRDNATVFKAGRLQTK